MHIIHHNASTPTPAGAPTRASTLMLCVQLVGIASDLTRNMRREFKASIGAKIRDEYCGVMVLLARAQNDACSAIHASQLRDGVNIARMLTQVAQDNGLLSKALFARAMSLCDRVDAQATALLASAIAQAHDALQPTYIQGIGVSEACPDRSKLPEEDFAWDVVEAALRRAPAEASDQSAIHIGRFDLRSSVVEALAGSAGKQLFAAGGLA